MNVLWITYRVYFLFTVTQPRRRITEHCVFACWIFASNLFVLNVVNFFPFFNHKSVGVISVIIINLLVFCVCTGVNVIIVQQLSNFNNILSVHMLYVYQFMFNFHSFSQQLFHTWLNAKKDYFAFWYALGMSKMTVLYNDFQKMQNALRTANGECWLSFIWIYPYPSWIANKLLWFCALVQSWSIKMYINAELLIELKRKNRVNEKVSWWDKEWTRAPVRMREIKRCGRL